MSSKEHVAANLAAAFLAGSWSVSGMVRRAGEAWGRRERWLRTLATRLVERLGTSRPQLDVAALAAIISGEGVFERAWGRGGHLEEFPLRRVFWMADVMAPAAGAPASWSVPALTSAGQVADWLGPALRELDWFAGCRGHGRWAPPGPLRHYAYRWLTGRRGKVRLLEIPRGRLKALQRRRSFSRLSAPRLRPRRAVAASFSGKLFRDRGP